MKTRREMMATEYWFNTKTNQVEEGKQSIAYYRIGPFATRAEAERAYELIKERNEKLDEEDQSWE